MCTLMIFLAVCSPVLGGSDQNTKGIEAKQEEETALDKLNVAVKKYLKMMWDKSDKEAELIYTVKTRWAERLKQKMIDHNFTEDACLTQMALDWLSDQKSLLEKEPDVIPSIKIVELCTTFQFFYDRKVTPSNWKDYETSIQKWEKWLCTQTDVTKK